MVKKKSVDVCQMGWGLYLMLIGLRIMDGLRRDWRAVAAQNCHCLTRLTVFYYLKINYR